MQQTQVQIPRPLCLFLLRAGVIWVLGFQGSLAFGTYIVRPLTIKKPNPTSKKRLFKEMGHRLLNSDRVQLHLVTWSFLLYSSSTSSCFQLSSFWRVSTFMSMASYVDPEIRPCLLIEIQGYLFMLYSRFLFCSRKPRLVFIWSSCWS